MVNDNSSKWRLEENYTKWNKTFAQLATLTNSLSHPNPEENEEWNEAIVIKKNLWHRVNYLPYFETVSKYLKEGKVLHASLAFSDFTIRYKIQIQSKIRFILRSLLPIIKSKRIYGRELHQEFWTALEINQSNSLLYEYHPRTLASSMFKTIQGDSEVLFLWCDFLIDLGLEEITEELLNENYQFQLKNEERAWIRLKLSLQKNDFLSLLTTLKEYKKSPYMVQNHLQYIKVFEAHLALRSYRIGKLQSFLPGSHSSLLKSSDRLSSSLLQLDWLMLAIHHSYHRNDIESAKSKIDLFFEIPNVAVVYPSQFLKVSTLAFNLLSKLELEHSLTWPKPEKNIERKVFPFATKFGRWKELGEMYGNLGRYYYQKRSYVSSTIAKNRDLFLSYWSKDEDGLSICFNFLARIAMDQIKLEDYFHSYPTNTFRNIEKLLAKAKNHSMKLRNVKKILIFKDIYRYKILLILLSILNEKTNLIDLSYKVVQLKQLETTLAKLGIHLHYRVEVTRLLAVGKWLHEKLDTPSEIQNYKVLQNGIRENFAYLQSIEKDENWVQVQKLIAF